jgi:hypothetical protein
LIEKYRKILTKLKETRLEPNSFVFLFFLLVSTIFWFFNALNKKYVAIIQIPVEFVNFPENKLVTGESTDYVDVKIATNGYSFIKYKSAALKKTVINLQLHSIYKVNEADDRRFYLLTSTIKNEISGFFDRDVEIKSISPDSIVFNLNEVIKKKVPVMRNFLLNYRKQYMLKDEISLIPDSVLIKGVASVLDTVDFVYTQTKVFDDVHDSLEFDIDLEKTPDVEYSSNTVKCIVPVEEFAELSFVLPIEIENLAQGYTLKLFPAEAKVVCNVGFSEYRQVFKQQFRFTVDYNDLEKKSERIKLNLSKFPDNVQSIRYYPISVEYLLEEND